MKEDVKISFTVQCGAIFANAYVYGCDGVIQQVKMQIPELIGLDELKKKILRFKDVAEAHESIAFDETKEIK